MANEFGANFNTKLAKIFLNGFESARSLSKMVDTQLYAGKFNPDSGNTVEIKRPTDYTARRTSDGDISAFSPKDIVTAKAVATVQDYFTVDVEIAAIDQALKTGQLPELMAPISRRIVTDFETDFAAFMLKNAGLSIGSPDTSVTTWQHVADSGALMKSIGVPAGQWSYVMNPFTMALLANTVRSIGAGGVMGAEIKTSLQKATILENFAGFDKVIAGDTLAPLTTKAISDRAGTLSADPDVTYATGKNSMTQTLAVTAFTASLEVQAGEIVEITGRHFLNQSTRKTFLDGAGNELLFRAVVTAPVTLGSSGEGNLVVSGPMIFESDGAYNTVDSAPVSGDVITLLGTASTAYQPNMFFHKNAFSLVSIPQVPLNNTSVMATTEDGLQIRVTKYSDERANVNGWRFDFVPAYSVLNPFLAGQGHA